MVIRAVEMVIWQRPGMRLSFCIEIAVARSLEVITSVSSAAIVC